MTGLCQCSPDCTVEFGKCHCGCGERTFVAVQNSSDRGWVKGQPVRFRRGHVKGVRAKHILSEVDVLNRTATCANCGFVTIKKNGKHRSTGEQVWKCHGSLVTGIHRLSDVDEVARTAWCRGCGKRVGVNKSGDRFLCRVSARRRDDAYRAANKERISKAHKAWRDANRDRIRDQFRKRTYGLATREYEILLAEQGGVCAICRNPPRGGHRSEELHIDHCHTTGAVRGLLCNDCNRGIGIFRDDPAVLKRAADYLSRDHL